MTLTSAEAASLRYIGERLASQKQWWGNEESDEEQSPRTVVRCHAVSGSEYRVRVSDAIGVIGLEHTQLIVEPKIALPHLLYLFAASEQFPRHLLERTHLGSDASFFNVIAMWFVQSCEVVLRHGLVNDYTRITGDLACARGRIHTVKTARSVLVGRPVIRCDYDLRSDDTSLNRVLKAASLRLLGWPGLSNDLHARCRRIQYRLSDVGDLEHRDTMVRLDPLTRIYKDALPLARLILKGSSVAIHEGAQSMWTFLCRTPDAVELGVRNSLSQRLGTRWNITKRGMILTGDRKRKLNPDLVFGQAVAVGDVKYKVSDDGAIGRADLNQIATFATGYGVNAGVVIGFSNEEVGERIGIGPVDIRGINWNIDEPDPGRAADHLADHLETWLKSLSSTGIS
ncbi:McrC family protein [Mycobacterium sp. NPDC051198]